MRFSISSSTKVVVVNELQQEQFAFAAFVNSRWRTVATVDDFSYRKSSKTFLIENHPKTSLYNTLRYEKNARRF